MQILYKMLENKNVKLPPAAHTCRHVVSQLETNRSLYRIDKSVSSTW